MKVLIQNTILRLSKSEINIRTIANAPTSKIEKKKRLKINVANPGYPNNDTPKVTIANSETNKITLNEKLSPSSSSVEAAGAVTSDSSVAVSSSLGLISPKTCAVVKIIANALTASTHTSISSFSCSETSKYKAILRKHSTVPSKIIDNVTPENTRSARSSEILNNRQRPFHGAKITRTAARDSVINNEYHNTLASTTPNRLLVSSSLVICHKRHPPIRIDGITPYASAVTHATIIFCAYRGCSSVCLYPQCQIINCLSQSPIVSATPKISSTYQTLCCKVCRPSSLSPRYQSTGERVTSHKKTIASFIALKKFFGEMSIFFSATKLPKST